MSSARGSPFSIMEIARAAARWLPSRISGARDSKARLPVPLEGEASSAVVISARQKIARDHDSLDLIRSLVDLGGLGVTEVALHRKLLDVAIPSEELDCVDGGPHGHVG